MREIPLTKGKVTFVDDEDFELLKNKKCFATFNGKKYYAATSEGHQKIVLLHRLLLQAHLYPRLVVDHIDGDPLNNTRSNIRLVSAAENLANMKSKGGFKGIRLDKRRGVWRAEISVNNRNKLLGVSSDPVWAALIRDEGTRLYQPRCGLYNFPLREGEKSALSDSTLAETPEALHTFRCFVDPDYAYIFPDPEMGL